MKIGKKFNQLSKSQYIHYIDNYKKYTDFNTLGLYRSILENEQLALSDKIEMRDYANRFFGKFYTFLQVKDPDTFLNLSTLGIELTTGERRQLWNKIRQNQQSILKKKRIKHRNFGVYSKHICGYKDCGLDGIMFKQGRDSYTGQMIFDNDKGHYQRKYKAKKKAKIDKKILKDELQDYTR